jgi:ferredoxin
MNVCHLFVVLFILSECCVSYRFPLSIPFNYAQKLSLNVKDRKQSLEEILAFPKNAEGNFYVTEQCVDCDVCRWMCPKVFEKKNFFTTVERQPETTEEKIAAYQALVTCPTGAIKVKVEESIIREAIKSLPKEIDPISIPGVYHTGFHSPESYSCIPYFIKREAGNILIDCPRYNEYLAENIKSLGGIHTLIVTHTDDAPHHKIWKEVFPDMIRVIHMLDVDQDTEGFEVQLKGMDKWFPDNDVEIIFTSVSSLDSIVFPHFQMISFFFLISFVCLPLPSFRVTPLVVLVFSMKQTMKLSYSLAIIWLSPRFLVD